jgi:hypothetical protein
MAIDEWVSLPERAATFLAAVVLYVLTSVPVVVRFLGSAQTLRDAGFKF